MPRPQPNSTETAAQQESLRAIIESISNELELRPLLTQIVKHACTLLDADRGSIGLVDAAQNLIRTEAIYQMPPDELGAEMPAGVGLAGRVLETGKVEILNHYADVDYPLLPELAEDAVLGLPIFWHEEMIGFFGIGAESPRRFNDYDIKLLASLARHAAVAIKNARLFERTNQALSETQLLYQTSQRISLAMTVEEVIEAYLEQVARQSRYVCSIATYAYDEAGKRVGIVMRGQWSSEKGMLLMNERLPYMRGGLDPFLDRGDTIIFSDVRSDPRASDILRSIQEKDGRPALVLIPLIMQNRRIGLVALSYTQPYQWPESELWKYQVTAVQLATAIYIRRQHLLLAESEREIAVLQERQILARELHDSVTQLIFSMTLIAQTIAPAWQREPAQGQKRVDRLLDLSRSALSEMRALLFELRSTDETPLPAHTEIRLSGLARLQRDGLIVALKHHIQETEQEGPKIKLLSRSYASLQHNHEIALFRITQEALNNIVKHAQAKCVKITLSVEKEWACLSIVDDGAGFDVLAPNKHKLTSGLGLRTMQERAEDLGGTLHIRSQIGQGTAVNIQLPRHGEER